MPRFSVMIARFPGGNAEHPCGVDFLVETVLKMKADERIGDIFPWRLSDTPITMSRNRAVKDALAKRADYLIMLDADMEFDPKGQDGQLKYRGAQPFWDSSWEWLMKHRDTPCAIAAPYCGPSPDNNIYVFLWRNRRNDFTKADHFSLEQFGRDEAARRGGIEEVAALPTGLIIYDMRVFQTMPPLKDRGWFYYEWTDDTCSQKASTEDVTQTRDMSLAYLMSNGVKGGKVYCNWDAWARHIKLEHIDKPVVMTADMVSEHFKAALASGHVRGDRLVMVGGGSAVRNGPLTPVRPFDVAGSIELHDRLTGKNPLADSLLVREIASNPFVIGEARNPASDRPASPPACEASLGPLPSAEDSTLPAKPVAEGEASG